MPDNLATEMQKFLATVHDIIEHARAEQAHENLRRTLELDEGPLTGGIRAELGRAPRCHE